MVRPMTSTENNWNPVWYRQLRKQACYVVQAIGANSIDLDELINVAWYSDVRYIDSETEILQYTRRIRKRMFYYLKTKYPSLAIKQKPLSEFINYDDIGKLIDDTELAKRCIESLSDDDARLLNYYFTDGLTFSQIGEKFNVTKQCVHQRLHEVINKIRSYLRCQEMCV